VLESFYMPWEIKFFLNTIENCLKIYLSIEVDESEARALLQYAENKSYCNLIKN
jgi:hypothetical protein